jgi:hypothetical protein
MATEQTLTLVIPIIVGLIIGILEAYFVYEDENMTSGKDFLGDMWHGLIFAMLGVVVASNIPYITSLEGFPEFLKGILFVDENGNSIVASIIITLFMMVKMVASHAIKGISGGGFSEKFWHKILVSSLVGFAPYYIALIPIPESIIGLFPESLP